MQADVGGVLGKGKAVKSFNQSHLVYFSIVPSPHTACFSSCGCCRELPKSHQGQGKAPLNPVTINCVRALNVSLKLLKDRNCQYYLMHCPALIQLPAQTLTTCKVCMKLSPMLPWPRCQGAPSSGTSSGMLRASLLWGRTSKHRAPAAIPSPHWVMANLTQSRV